MLCWQKMIQNNENEGSIACQQQYKHIEGILYTSHNIKQHKKEHLTIILDTQIYNKSLS